MPPTTAPLLRGKLRPITYDRIDQIPPAIKLFLQNGIAQLDRNCKARADEFLVKAAKNAVMDSVWHSHQGAKFVVMEQGRATEYGAVFLGKLTVAVGIGFAGIGMAAMVGTSVATFGIMPVLGLVVGYGAKLSLEEWRYQRSSGRLHAALEKISATGTSSRKFVDATWIPMFLDTITEAGDKINTKYLRLARMRGWSMGIKKGSPHLSDASPQDILKGTQLLHANQKKSSDTPKSDSMALAALELHFYSQTLFNLCDEFLKEISLRRVEFRESMWQVRHAINLQVHFLGKHTDCGSKCVGFDPAIKDQSERLFTDLGRMLRATSRPMAGATANFKSDFEDGIRAAAMIADASPGNSALSEMSGTNTSAAKQARANLKAAESRLEKYDTFIEIAESGMMSMTADFGASQAVAAGVEGAQGTIKALHDIATNAAGEGVREAASSAMSAVGMGSVVESALDLAISLFKNRHHTQKIGALATDRVAQIMDQNYFKEAVADADKAKFTREHLGYLGKKVAHYFHKVDTLAKSQEQLFASAKTSPAGLFASCENAHNVWYDLCYVDKQFAKLEMSVISFMAVMLKMDQKLHFYSLTLPGSMVRADTSAAVHVPSYHGHMKQKKY
jgi:hypothetical protein